MRGFHAKYSSELTQVIAEVESRTSAELVVVIEGHSGSYRDVDFATGAALAWLCLAVLLFGPGTHAPISVLIDTAFTFGVGAWGCSRLPELRRRLTRERRRARQVQTAAEAAFCAERVWTTRGRTGVLLYLSLLERQVVLLPDRAVSESVDAPAWNDQVLRLQEIWSAPNPAEALLDGLRRLGGVLAEALPVTADDVDELPNAPRGRR